MKKASMGWMPCNMRRLEHIATPVLMCALTLTLSGCITRDVRLEGGSPFPESPRFTIQPREYSAEELASYGLRTDGVYVDTGEVPPEKHDPAVVSGYTFYRFWPDGRVMFRIPGIGALNPTDVAAVDALRYGNVGYYEFTEDGGVKVELFLPVGMTYKYGWIVFSKEEDTLWIQSANYIRFHPLSHMTDRIGYRFMHFDGLTATPDW